jgi:transposase
MLVDKDLSERMHNCPFCSLSKNRDLNAFINVLKLGLQLVRKINSPFEFSRGESHDLDRIITGNFGKSLNLII